MLPLFIIARSRCNFITNCRLYLSAIYWSLMFSFSTRVIWKIDLWKEGVEKAPPNAPWEWCHRYRQCRRSRLAFNRALGVESLYRCSTSGISELAGPARPSYLEKRSDLTWRQDCQQWCAINGHNFSLSEVHPRTLCNEDFIHHVNDRLVLGFST
jgi:hypothetical protein